jgi:hypothetical protein
MNFVYLAKIKGIGIFVRPRFKRIGCLSIDVRPELLIADLVDSAKSF